MKSAIIELFQVGGTGGVVRQGSPLLPNVKQSANRPPGKFELSLHVTISKNITLRSVRSVRLTHLMLER